MTISKKLLLIILFGLMIPVAELAATQQKHNASIQTCICDFDPERDTQSIINIFNKNWSTLIACDDFSPSEWLLSYTNNSYSKIYILRENDTVAGFIAYYMKTPKKGFIDALAIEQNFRNKGYGEMLVKYVIKTLEAEGINSIKLGTDINNIPAQNLYKKVGFRNTTNKQNVAFFKYTSTSNPFFAPISFLRKNIDLLKINKLDL